MLTQMHSATMLVYGGGKMNEIKVTVMDMMQARDARAQMQRTLLMRYPGSTVVCLCMNIAGPVKTTPRIERAFAWGADRVRAVLAPHVLCFDEEIHVKTGPEAIFCVHADARLLKQRLCALEDEEALGRLLDIDVLEAGGEKVARTELGLPPRRCLLCDQPAPVCARSRTHSVEALFARANEMIDRHFEEDFVRRAAENAQRALLYEVAITPKPGLVDRANAGAHTDMDVFTFMDSACALRPYYEHCVRVGLAHREAPLEACFDALRVPGLLAEAWMRRATAGVNTHKGAIFSLGIACAALAMGYGQEESPEQVLLRCGEMTRQRMEQELRCVQEETARTFGEQLYLASGVGGVRAEAASGFSSVRNIGLPRLRTCLQTGMSINDAGLCVLVALMACTQDTNALHRGGEEGARAMRMRALQLNEVIEKGLAVGGLQMDRVRADMQVWDAQLSQARISPGGCADLLALTLWIYFEYESRSGKLKSNC